MHVSRDYKLKSEYFLPNRFCRYIIYIIWKFFLESALPNLPLHTCEVRGKKKPQYSREKVTAPCVEILLH